MAVQAPTRYCGWLATLRDTTVGDSTSTARFSTSDRNPDRYHSLEAMPATARLNDIVEALEIQFDESLSFLDRDTGQVETVSKELLSEAEEPGDEELDLPEWQQQEWELAKQIVASDRFLKLPSKFDIHEWSIMEEFSQSVKSERTHADLLHAIHGAGAFRNFKYIIRRDGIEKSWFVFRSEALREIAITGAKKTKLPGSRCVSFIPRTFLRSQTYSNNEVYQRWKWERGERSQAA